MRTTLIVFALMHQCSSVNGVEFDWAAVGNPGNAASVSAPGIVGSGGEGSVDYEFRISKHEVTNEQYAEFLASAAIEDPHELFHPDMRITRTGTNGNFAYEAKAGFERHPVMLVSFFSAMRFVNWLENGQGSGGTESGTYAIGDGISETRASNANYFVPSNDEWYKAAFYDPTKEDGAGGYWCYATHSCDFPTFEAPPGGENSVNTAESELGTTEVGAYFNSTSYYGTFDQTGNAWEWTEARDEFHPFRCMRGGGTGSSIVFLTTCHRPEIPGDGFRVARRGPIPGDFDDDGVLSTADIDALTAAIIANSNDEQYDLDSDGSIHLADHSHWVKDLANTWVGDADLDGEFNSSDLVIIFQAGEYEDGVMRNSGWASGDWNADGDFTTSDLTVAFQVGGFEMGPRAATAVPEPSGAFAAFAAIATTALAYNRRGLR